ncbi:hypothetical protein MMAD_12140 [Mycolicibacterium madagascariense]|uniref:Uncharacterized protein n=1 Tax=Mycolicibacterium madagascariense TaxID=212765 RepID=A0A7I7XAW9_9MYCO|nr:hypothetical protein MMAD_12140 [Mycolicibacterium madagascariense]
MTVAPASAARRTAAASVSTSPTPAPEPPTVRNMLLDCRIDRIAASGAMPPNVPVPLCAAPTIPATIVPWPSQSCVPSPVET